MFLSKFFASVVSVVKLDRFLVTVFYIFFKWILIIRDVESPVMQSIICFSDRNRLKKSKSYPIVIGVGADFELDYPPMLIM